MSGVHLFASHPDFKKFDFMQRLLLMAINPQMYFGFEVDIPEAERLATVELIREDMGRVMDDYQFLPHSIAEHINKLEDRITREEEHDEDIFED